MRFQLHGSRALRLPLLVGSLVIVAGVGIVGARVAAQSEPATEAPSQAPAKAAVPRRKPRVAHKSPAAQETLKSAAKEEAVAPAPKANDEKASDGKANDKAPFDFAAQLDRAGATACRTQLNVLAVSTMGSVEKFNTLSSWSQAAGDKRAVSIAIGQKYADTSAVPFGASEIIAAPNQQGSCDGISVQVIPSPLSCTKLRDSMSAQHGRQLGDLAGISIMQDNGAGRTMLVPTKADTCVLVATRSFYAK